MALWLDTMMEPLAMFRPRRGFVATPAIVCANIALWVIMVISGVDFFDPEAEALLQWGGNLDSRVRDGEVWRLFSSLFLHSGIIHLVMNMITLAVIGLELERRIGTILFSIAYLVTGILASITSAMMNDGVVSVGASGAVFGMFGTLLSLLLLNAFPRKVRKNLLALIIAFIAANFFDLADQGVDHWAHFGGLSGGLLVGLFYRMGVRPTPDDPQEDPKLTQEPEPPQVIATGIAASTETPEAPEGEVGEEELQFEEPNLEAELPKPLEPLIGPVPDLPIPPPVAGPEPKLDEP